MLYSDYADYELRKKILIKNNNENKYQQTRRKKKNPLKLTFHYYLMSSYFHLFQCIQCPAFHKININELNKFFQSKKDKRNEK